MRPSASTAGDEKRTEARHDTYMPGRVGVGAAESRDCTVRDISAAGARLIFAEAIDLPQEFDLLILTTGEHCRVATRWRRGRQVGVHFLHKDEIFTLDVA
jgi:PilZ domain